MLLLSQVDLRAFALQRNRLDDVITLMLLAIFLYSLMGTVSGRSTGPSPLCPACPAPCSSSG